MIQKENDPVRHSEPFPQQQPTDSEYTDAPRNPQIRKLRCDRKHCGCLPRWATCPARDWVLSQAVQR